MSTESAPTPDLSEGLREIAGVVDVLEEQGHEVKLAQPEGVVGDELRASLTVVLTGSSGGVTIQPRDDTVTEDTDEDDSEDMPPYATVEDALDELTELQAADYRAVEMQGIPKEVRADERGVSSQAVYQNVKKARERLDELVPDQDGDSGDDAGDTSSPEATAGAVDDDVEVDIRVERDRMKWSDWSADNAGNGVRCQNCESHVQKDFARVLEPDEEGGPRCCPNCKDLIREGDGTVREARATRSGGPS